MRSSAAHLVCRFGEMGGEVHATSHFLPNFDPHRHLAIFAACQCTARVVCSLTVSCARVSGLRRLLQAVISLPPPSATAATLAADAASLAADAIHRVAAAIPSLQARGERPASVHAAA